NCLLLLLPLPLIIYFISSTLVNGGKVLVFPLDGSHWINMKVIIEELHSRGHEITPELFVINTLKMQREGAPLWTRLSIEYELLSLFYQINKDVLQMMGEIFENTKLMQSLHDAKYDVVLTDPAMGGGVLLSHRLGLPLVLNVRWTILGEAHQAIAPSPLSYVPISFSKLTDKMIFSQRVKNFMYYLFTRFQIWFMADPTYKPFVHHYFGSDVHYMELFQAADIWLMRNDFIFEFPRPTMPNIIYMSGFQCKPSKPLFQCQLGLAPAPCATLFRNKMCR
uniref:UDP glucuronosyltransferase 5 family, polypeptide D1 n=1 Tax=Monopterus albus TaxID=43700 RepID=A0A3Q3Q9X7_MONAL